MKKKPKSKSSKKNTAFVGKGPSKGKGEVLVNMH